MSNIEFTSASRLNQSAGVKCMVYGTAGIGKTVLVATMPRPLMISNESGTLSLSKKNLEKLFGVGNQSICYDVPIMKVTTMAGLIEAYNWVTKSAEAKNFDSIGLDSLSEMAEVILNNAKKVAKDPRQAYGDVITQTEEMVRAFRDLQNKHVYFAGKIEPVKDEFTGMVKYGIAMPGQKLGPKLPYFFDELFVLRSGQTPAGEKYRYLQTQPEIQYEAKDRSGALDAAEYPHLGAVFNKILEFGK